MGRKDVCPVLLVCLPRGQNISGKLQKCYRSVKNPWRLWNMSLSFHVSQQPFASLRSVVDQLQQHPQIFSPPCIHTLAMWLCSSSCQESETLPNPWYGLTLRLGLANWTQKWVCANSKVGAQEILHVSSLPLITSVGYSTGWWKIHGPGIPFSHPIQQSNNFYTREWGHPRLASLQPIAICIHE